MEELNTIDNEIKELQEQANKIYYTIGTLTQKRIELVFKLIKDTKLLKNSTWTVADQHIFEIELDEDCSIPNKEKIFTKLSNYFKADYHDHFEYDLIDFVFNDGKLSIYSKDSDKFFNFIKEHEIIIDISEYEKQIEKLEIKKIQFIKVINKYKN